jgi:hypothetical protein
MADPKPRTVALRIDRLAVRVRGMPVGEAREMSRGLGEQVLRQLARDDVATTIASAVAARIASGKEG